MSNGYLPYARQSIDDEDIRAVVDVLRSPLITQGPMAERFERELGNVIGCDHVSVCSSGTAALHLAYAALGLGPGDEIITTPITFVATASAARMLGAEVRFAEVEPDTGNLDARSVESLINGRTVGLVAVHLAGLPVELAALRKIADRHGLWLLDDAAHALGATYHGAPIGSGLSDVSTFSFHPVKHVTTGEGGAVAVSDAELKVKVELLREHGIVRDGQRIERATDDPWYYEVQCLGFNYRLSDISCALGISQLAKQRDWLARRREIAARYRERIAARFGSVVAPQATREQRDSAYHLFPVLIDFALAGTSRADVMSWLQQAGIGSQVHYIPITRHPYFVQRYGAAIEGAGVRQYYERTLSLPMYPGLANADVDRVVDALAVSLEHATVRRQEVM